MPACGVIHNQTCRNYDMVLICTIDAFWLIAFLNIHIGVWCHSEQSCRNYSRALNIQRRICPNGPGGRISRAQASRAEGRAEENQCLTKLIRYRVITVHTHSNFIQMPHRGTSPRAPWLEIPLSHYPDTEPTSPCHNLIAECLTRKQHI